MMKRVSPLECEVNDADWLFFTQEVWINKLDRFQKSSFKAVEFRDVELYWCILEQLYAGWKGLTGEVEGELK